MRFGISNQCGMPHRTLGAGGDPKVIFFERELALPAAVLVEGWGRGERMDFKSIEKSTY